MSLPCGLLASAFHNPLSNFTWPVLRLRLHIQFALVRLRGTRRVLESHLAVRTGAAIYGSRVDTERHKQQHRTNQPRESGASAGLSTHAVVVHVDTGGHDFSFTCRR
jgi:hypothetical protein